MSEQYSQIVAALQKSIRAIEQVGVYNEEAHYHCLGGATGCIDLAEVDEFMEDFVEIIKTESDTKLAALATLFLGIMINSGVVASSGARVPARAAEVIRTRVTVFQEDMVLYAAGVALSALGEPDAVQAMHKVMRMTGLSTQQQFDGLGITAVVTMIAKS